MARIVCVGEAMLELTRKGGDWKMGHGGDTLNTAIHLARAGHDVAYLTALGDDPFSHDLRAQWESEGLDCTLVLTHPTRQPGLYAIDTDHKGERSFTYWRDTSAARAMFDLPAIEAALETAAKADLLYFSLITLAILPATARARLLALARRSAKVAFDSNFRPRLWQDAREARAACDSAIALADIGLPTLEDETMLSGGISADEVARRWLALGCGETVVKLGARGCRLPDGRTVAPRRVIDPIDTSGAGDAFNAGYLGARLEGASPEDAARAGQASASWTIMRPGAIPPRDS